MIPRDPESEAKREEHRVTDYLTVDEVNQYMIEDFEGRIGGDHP